MIAENAVSNNDIIDMAGYNVNLFSYTIIKMPFPQYSPMQEFVLDTFFDPSKHYRELLFACGRKCVAKDTLVFTKNGAVDYIQNVGFSTGIKPVYEVITVRGRKIKTSADHKFLTPDGWKKLSDLRKHDKICVPEKLEIWGNEILDEEKVKLIAYLNQDGSWGKGQSLRFTNCDKKLLAEVYTSALSSYGIKGKYNHKNGRSPNAFDLTLTQEKKIANANQLYNWIRSLEFKNEFPTIIFSLKKELVALFINRSFACCGCVSTHYRSRNHQRTNETQTEIVFADGNHEKVRFYQMLLYKFGIISQVQRRSRERCTVLRIADSESLRLFIQEIGNIYGKENACNKIVYHKSQRKDRTVDVIKSIIYVGEEETYDQTVEPESQYIANGFIVHNSAKSVMSSVISLFSVYKMLTQIRDPHEYYGIPQKKRIYFQLLAANREQAQDISFDYIRSFASTSPYLRNHIKNSTNDEIEFDNKLCIKVYNSSARSVRGESSALIIFDELAHWIDNRGNLSGDEIYTAAMPNLKVMKHEGKPGDAKSVLLSSPAGRQGIFWELFKTGDQVRVLQPTLEAGENPWRCVLQAATWEMNSKYEFKCKNCPNVNDANVCNSCPSFDLKIEWVKNPDKFECEYNGLFVDTINPALSRENIMACVSDKIFCDLTQEDKATQRVIALDPALTGDQYALVMCHMEGDVIVVDLVKIWNALDKEHPIQLRLVQEYVEHLCKNFAVNGIVVDQFQSASTVQALQEKGLPAILVPATSKSNQTSYERMINRINTRTIMYPPHKTLLNELSFLQRKVAGKSVRYEASINSTDDICDAIARAVEYLEVHSGRRIMVDKL
jgi:hypothetical protein